MRGLALKWHAIFAKIIFGQNATIFLHSYHIMKLMTENAVCITRLSEEALCISALSSLYQK